MAARNEKSLERERAPEPTSLIDILEQTHREIRSLFHEMAEILETPTALYELYPRIRIALEIHDLAEEATLYPALKKFSDLADAAKTSEEEHHEMKQKLIRLDEKPWRKQQIESTEWKTEFHALHGLFVRHVEHEEKEIFPELTKRLSAAQFDELGQQYRTALHDDSTPENFIAVKGEKGDAVPANEN
jgi:hypothetical protein